MSHIISFKNKYNYGSELDVINILQNTIINSLHVNYTLAICLSHPSINIVKVGKNFLEVFILKCCRVSERKCFGFVCVTFIVTSYYFLPIPNDRLL